MFHSSRPVSRRKGLKGYDGPPSYRAMKGPEVIGLTKGGFGASEDLVLFEAIEDSEAEALVLFLFLEELAEAAVPKEKTTENGERHR